jgi:predicted nucleic acid-binding protein
VILYADSSSILSIHFEEPGRYAITRSVFDSADRVACSILAFVEVRAGLARARFKENPPRLDESRYRRALRDFQHDWHRAYARVNIQRSLVSRAAELAEKHRLRAYDAIHLASAVALNLELPDLQVATWDHDLAAAAVTEGLPMAHEVDA